MVLDWIPISSNQTSLISDVLLSTYTEGLWSMFPEDEQPDPLFKQHLIHGYQTCHEMAQGVPEDYLKMKGQLYEKLGRQKIFFECANVIIFIQCPKSK